VPGRGSLLTAPTPGFLSAVTSAFIATLGANRQPLRVKAAEPSAPVRVRWIEPHNNAASHGHEADDVTVGATPTPNANTAPDEQLSIVTALGPQLIAAIGTADQNPLGSGRSVSKHRSSTRPVA